MNTVMPRLLFSVAATAASLTAAITVTLTPDLPSPQPLGTTIRWTATVTDTDPGSHLYRFNTQPTGRPVQVRKDFSPDNTWTWTPSGYEDTVRIVVIVVNRSTGAVGFATRDYTLTSRLHAGTATISRTNHPLVALFSAPPCLIPNSMRVRFWQVGQTRSTTTNLIECRTDSNASTPNLKSLNFYIAGMYPSTTYLMQWETVSPGGTLVTAGTPHSFTTGAIPAGINFPNFTVTVPPASSDIDQPILLVTAGGDTFHTVAMDLAGKPLWYYPVPEASPDRTWFGGTMLVRDGPVLREIDLAGNTLLETTDDRIGAQLVEAGHPRSVNSHHDVRRISAPGRPVDGYIVTLGYVSILSTQHQGGTPSNPVEILGDSVIVLDRNMQLAWAWNPFLHLDLNRPAILGDTCTPSTFCKPILTNFAHDWTHANSVQYDNSDGNLIVSLRHQDWAIKINFADGTGDGRVIWRLGRQGDFSITTVGTSTTHDIGFPWFSYQHDTEFELRGATFGGRKVMTVFDNGNTRQARFNPNAHSRCQSYAVDEVNRTVNLNVNADLGVYSSSRGNAQLMTNGNFHCDAAAIQGPGGATMQSSENDRDGNLVYVIRSNQPAYRTFRMRDLYTPVTP